MGSEKTQYVGKLPIGFKPEAPPPAPLKNLIIGPAIITLGLAIGSGELIFWPIMSANIGPVLLWAALISLIFQTIWTLEMARWTVWTGEHWVLQMARIQGLASAAILWGLFTFLAWGFGGWAAAGGRALYVLTGGPGEEALATVVWAIFLFFLVWVVALLAGVVREWVEYILTFKMVVIWVMLLVSLAVVTSADVWADVLKGIFIPSWPGDAIPEQVSYFTLAAAIAFIGAGGTTNMWYSFWVRDAGYGMGVYIGRIPGYLRGRPTELEIVGYLPEPTEENIARLKAWWSNVRTVFWGIFFLLNFLTAVFFVALVYSGKKNLGIETAGVSGVEVIKLQADIVEKAFGVGLASSLFLLVAAVLLFGTQLSLTEGVARQIADSAYVALEPFRRLFRNDIRTAYFAVITLFALWSSIWISTINLAGIRPVLLLQLPANINLVFQIISIPLTLYFIYYVAGKSLPKEIWNAMKPHPIIPVLLILAMLYWGVFAVLGWMERFGLLG
ncbi:MAG: Nramp family divalent metal transporter [Aeropyrum sp.]|nr:Nramp family divalent metal transporter [Aeropyrum sp.]MCE4615491.1 Nramp family divalent metal transporter [Aeropyrum sp.]